MPFTAHRRTRRATAVLALALTLSGATAAVASAAVAATPPALTATAGQYGLAGWIAQAQAALAAHGDYVPSAAAIEARAMTESSGNPNARTSGTATPPPARRPSG